MTIKVKPEDKRIIKFSTAENQNIKALNAEIKTHLRKKDGVKFVKMELMTQNTVERKFRQKWRTVR